jgi:hypothetical protein
MFKVLKPFSHGSKMYATGETIGDHVQANQWLKKGLICEIKIVQPVSKEEVTEETKEVKKPRKARAKK